MVETIETKCEDCGHVRSVPAAIRGKKFRCKSCEGIVIAEEYLELDEEYDESYAGESFDDEGYDDELYGGDGAGELDFSQLSSSGEALGSGTAITCPKCSEPYGSKSDECPSCLAPNPRLVKKAKEREARKLAAAEEKKEVKPRFNFYDQYRVLFVIGGTIAFVVAVVAGLGYALIRGSQGTQSLTGRTQVEYHSRTTAKWIELEKEGTARRAEVLWRDQRWFPLEQAIRLDWAAVPDWFEALKDDRTKRLAEGILKLWNRTSGAPWPEDPAAGVADANEDVQYWAILIAAKLEHQSDKDDMVPALEAFRDGDNEKLAEAATKTLAAFAE